MIDHQDSKTLALPLSAHELARTPGALLQVPLALLEQTDQVRTHSGLDDSLDELAEDIAARGVIQPITVRLAEGEGTRYVIVAGHRRAFAAALAGLEFVPAILREATDEEAFELQLAENIQREGLSLQELAVAVRRLFDKHQDLTKVAEIVKKSKPWVSKHLAASCPEFGFQARRLLEQGISTDIELLGTVSQIEKVGISWSELYTLVEKIKKNKAGRAQARELLGKLKAKKAAFDAEQKAARGGAKKAKNQPAPVPAWNAESALSSFVRAVRSTDSETVAELTAELSAEQLAEMVLLLRETYDLGASVAGKPLAVVLRSLTVQRWGMGADVQAAWLLGAQGLELTLDGLAVELQQVDALKTF